MEHPTRRGDPGTLRLPLGVYPLSQEHLGDRRRRFLDAWIESRVDPRRMFVNPLIASLLGDEAA